MIKWKESALKAIAKAAEAEANLGRRDWPPPCIGYIYQPKRPKRNKKQ